MNRSFEEWIKIYNKKFPKKFEHTKNCEMLYLPDRGFCEIAFVNGKIFIYQVCGDGRFWKSFAEEAARRMNIKHCGTICTRKNIRAYIKLFGHKIISVDEKNNLKCFSTQDADGKKGILFECIFEDGSHGYEIFWEVPEAVKK